MENGKYLVFVSCLDSNPIGRRVSRGMVPPPRWIVFIYLKSTSKMNIITERFINSDIPLNKIKYLYLKTILLYLVLSGKLQYVIKEDHSFAPLGLQGVPQDILGSHQSALRVSK